MKNHIKQFLKSSFVFAFLFLNLTANSFADGDRAENGGSGDEAEIVTAQVTLETSINKVLLFFIQYPEARGSFPEIDFEKFLALRENVIMEVVDLPRSEFLDREGVPRDCLNGTRGNQFLIKCRLEYVNRFMDKPTSMFILGFHELLGLLGIEISTSLYEHQPLESYPISSRIARYVVQVNSYDLQLVEDLSRYRNVGEDGTIAYEPRINRNHQNVISASCGRDVKILSKIKTRNCSRELALRVCRDLGYASCTVIDHDRYYTGGPGIRYRSERWTYSRTSVIGTTAFLR